MSVQKQLYEDNQSDRQFRDQLLLAYPPYRMRFVTLNPPFYQQLINRSSKSLAGKLMKTGATSANFTAQVNEETKWDCEEQKIFSLLNSNS